jgi:hypothetical protein
MPLIPIVVIQLICGIHAVRTSQEHHWLYIIVCLPGVGCAIYFFAIVVPDLFASRDGKKFIYRLQDKFAPERHLRSFHNELAVAETSQNYLHLADELVRLGRFEQSIDYYQKALSGMFEHDPDIMVKLASAQFNGGFAADCLQTLDAVMQFNADYQSQEGHLLYARALTAIGDFIKAEDEFAVLVDYFSGPQARFYYYQMLRRQGRTECARQQLDAVINIARRSKPHYRRLHKVWLNQVNREIKTLK